MVEELRVSKELLKISEHIYYEYTMLKILAIDMARRETRKAHIYNAMLESFITHFRVLYDFLYLDIANRPDDTLAIDFFASPEEWTSIRPEPSTLLKEAKFRANKELAHLTYARIKRAEEDRVWQYTELEEEITRIFIVFLLKVPRELLCRDL